MTGFDARQAAFEAKYHHDEEMKFRVNARRAHLLAEWAGAKMGITGHDLEAYVARLGDIAFKHPSDSALVDAITEDFAARAMDVSRHRVEKQLDELDAVAREQLGANSAPQDEQA